MKSLLDNIIIDYNILSEITINNYYSNFSKYDNAFLINMKDRIDRLLEAKTTLDKVNISFNRFIAINGKEISGNFNYTDLRNKFPSLNDAEFGCALSHLAIFALAANHPNQNNFTMIFEDDVVTSVNSFQHILNDVSSLDIDNSIDIVYLGKCLEVCSNMIHVKNTLYVPAEPSCLHAYMIKNSYAKKFLSYIDTLDELTQTDIMIKNQIINGEINSLALHPSIFFQNVLSTKSDLRSNYMPNYEECRDAEQGVNQVIVKEKEIVIQKEEVEVEVEVVNNKGMIITIIIALIIIFMIIMYYKKLINNKTSI